MQAARWRRVLGRTDPVMTPYESGLAAALAPEHVPEPEQLKAEILSIYAKFNLFDGTVHQRAALHLHLDGLLAKLATKAMPTQMIKTDRVTVEHSSSVDAVGGGLAVDKRRAHITLKQNAAQDRAYIESCFGRSLYPPERLRKAEQELCVGDHLGCHLWFSAGVPSPEQAPTPEAKHLAEQAELQADRKRQQNRHRNAASGFKRLAADNAAEAGCSTQRQVDAAGAEQESHGHGNHDPEGRRAENIHQIVEAKEVFIDKAHNDHQDDQRNGCARFFLR